MRNGEALMAKGKRVGVTGYKPARIGTILGFEWWGRRGKKAMYVRIDFGPTLGIIEYKAKWLKLAD